MTDPPAQHERFRGRLSIPYLTDAGVVNMAFRCIRDHKCKETVIGKDDKGNPVTCAKLQRMKGWNNNLFGVQALEWADEWIAVCEGEFDAIILQQIGIPAVAVPGSEVWKEHWHNIFDDFSRIYLFADGDKAGADMLKKWQGMMPTKVISAKMPEGEDVNSVFVKQGPDHLLSRIRK